MQNPQSKTPIDGVPTGASGSTANEGTPPPKGPPKIPTQPQLVPEEPVLDEEQEPTPIAV